MGTHTHTKFSYSPFTGIFLWFHVFTGLFLCARHCAQALHKRLFLFGHSNVKQPGLHNRKPKVIIVYDQGKSLLGATRRSVHHVRLCGVRHQKPLRRGPQTGPQPVPLSGGLRRLFLGTRFIPSDHGTSPSATRPPGLECLASVTSSFDPGQVPGLPRGSAFSSVSQRQWSVVPPGRGWRWV